MHVRQKGDMAGLKVTFWLVFQRRFYQLGTVHVAGHQQHVGVGVQGVRLVVLVLQRPGGKVFTHRGGEALHRQGA